MRAFVYDHPATRVIFGIGSLGRLLDEVKRLGARRAIVLSTPEQRGEAEDAAHRLGGADGLDRAAKLATENPYYNPRSVEYSGVRQLLENAYYGKRPA